MNGPLALEAWELDAVCAQIGPDVFFPDQGHANSENRMAKQICITQCPVREQCLARALAYPGTIGIWGGTNERDRKEMRRDEREWLAA